MGLEIGNQIDSMVIVDWDYRKQWDHFFKRNYLQPGSVNHGATIFFNGSKSVPFFLPVVGFPDFPENLTSLI